MDFLTQLNINWNIIFATLIVAGVSLYLIYARPWLNKKNFDYFDEIKLALLLTGFAFRDEKIKLIVDIAYKVVSALEKYENISSEEKHLQAVQEISTLLVNEANIVLSEEALDLIVDITVSLLPATK